MQSIQSITRRSLNHSARLSTVRQPLQRRLPVTILHRGYATRPKIENDDPTPDKKEGGPDRESIPGDAGGVSVMMFFKMVQKQKDQMMTNYSSLHLDKIRFRK